MSICNANSSCIVDHIEGLYEDDQIGRPITITIIHLSYGQKFYMKFSIVSTLYLVQGTIAMPWLHTKAKAAGDEITNVSDGGCVRSEHCRSLPSLVFSSKSHGGPFILASC
ncbi:hypothetical protein FVEG_14876 [Fusarium verticillioides 7600]|uniref:Uncharacterized protein n=1 Tax=Gibberella moniliformis (strain M3125 / FGSC 7600) TaxID=334819 RepID=W7LFY8_GIBM7|nr:hypothetical protein FVEG_14876 [Fusarium verticillioides 7600]XP_018744544.1 hypothetical protein FVEG_14876 [Fusarium verticillioides 7600]EWG38352.1 hypothetical protein FVEG_14876 [Fusarium verticillioides 7600]EWG38353.1 hypothetical protein FVEG_14876 [Fusarium verticillioides 7600]